MEPKITKKAIELAKKVFLAESEAIESLISTIGDDFEKAVDLLANSKGKAVLTGLGKSAIIAQKITATFNSTGQPSVFMHAADALHGDIGILHKNDVVIALSKSGETNELLKILPNIKSLNCKLIAITGNINSSLARAADCTLDVFVKEEACKNNLAPTSSTTAALVMGDALAICLMDVRNFGKDNFAINHPAGSLGKKMLLKVSDIYTNNAIPYVSENTPVELVILEISSKRLGATAVLNSDNLLTGVITDGDLRRMLNKHDSIKGLTARHIMSKNPISVLPDTLATEALQLMNTKNITQLIVAEQRKLLGFVHLHDLLKEGID
jgi:arabinose-5-phosphate isomerase